MSNIKMKPAAQIIEMDQERDRKTCITLDLKVTGANRELAQWLLDHPRYSNRVVGTWLGRHHSYIGRLRKWATGGFEGTPFDSHNAPNSSRSGAAQRQGPLKPHNNSASGEYVPPDIDHPPRGPEWEKDPEDQDPPEPKVKNTRTSATRSAAAVEDDSEIASPEMIEDNMLHVLGGMNENARIFNKFFKISAFDREAVNRMVEAIDKTIGKLRSLQSTLKQKETVQ